METFTFSQKQEEELKQFLKEPNPFLNYGALWHIVKTVVENSHYGSSEYGGPVCFLDFRINNLKKLFPDTTFFSEIQKNVNSSIALELWFIGKLRMLIPMSGLNNVIFLTENLYEYDHEHKQEHEQEHIHLFSTTSFLEVLRWLLIHVEKDENPWHNDWGCIDKPSLEKREDSNLSGLEAKRVRMGNVMNYMDWKRVEGLLYPNHDNESYCEGRGALILSIRGLLVRKGPNGEDCITLRHFSKAKGFVIQETDTLAAMIRVMWDLMEGKSQGFEKILRSKSNEFLDKAGSGWEEWPFHYPNLPNEEYIDYNPCILPGNHIKETSNKLRIRTQDGEIMPINVNYPEIDPQHGQWWHRQFPPKTYWQELPE